MDLSRFDRCRQTALVVLCALSLTAHAQSVSEADLLQACERLQTTALAPGDLQVLLNASRQLTDAPALRSRAMAAYSLSLLLRGDTNTFERAADVLRTTFPDSPSWITVASRDAYAACSDCDGAGTRDTPCPSCMGKGACKTCGGAGRVAAGVCPSCKGSRACARCGGAKRIDAACATCKGTGYVFKPSAKIRENYNALLAALAAACQENIRFAERLREASDERDLEKRVSQFEALLRDFPKRTDLAGAQALFAEAKQKRDALAAQRLARETRDREAREAEELLRLRDAPDLNVALATLSAYLKDHPGTSAAAELQTLQQELLQRRNRRQTAMDLLKGAGLLIGLATLIALLIKVIFRKKPAPIGPLPGMEHIDKRAFTDPLTLTAKESRSRDQHRVPPSR